VLDLVSHGLHKIVIGGTSEGIAEILQTTSAKEIAQLVGVPRQYVTDWLSGRYKPSREHGLRLQAFLKKRRRR
jgi:transposase